MRPRAASARIALQKARRRVAEQGHREAQPLLLTARAQPHPTVGELGDARAAHHLVERARVGEQARGEGEGLAHRDVFEQSAGLQHGRDEPVRDRAARRLAEHAHRSAVGVGEAEQHVDRRGLAGPVRAEEGDDLACAHGQIDAVDGANGAETLAQTYGLDREGSLVLIHATDSAGASRRRPHTRVTTSP